jgi:homocysteine S-methyltransferase
MVKSKYRTYLPQLGGALFLSDGGLETSLIFHDKVELPCFAAFDLLKTPAGRERLRDYYTRYIAIARSHEVGFILESPTWRANSDWGAKLGYADTEIAAINRESIALMRELRDAYETTSSPMVVSGCVGPRFDGYAPERIMSEEEAQAYHTAQIATFSATAADLVSAFTMTNVNEAIGVTRAAAACDMPVAISFTLETDGRLPGGETLQEAIEAVDKATGNAVLYYMINCVHPAHFEATLAAGGAWVARLRGIRANASRRSHAELDSAPDLDAGDPVELGGQYRSLVQRHNHFNVFGGCCGTDHRHVEQIALACVAGV